MNLLRKILLVTATLDLYVYHYAIDAPCQTRDYIFIEGRFQMFFHLVLYYIYYNDGISRAHFDSKLVALLNNETILTFEKFRATFIIETNWKASHLPKQTFLFPSYFCRGEASNIVPVDNFHIFMIDKFLLCPQITLNSTEYQIDFSSHKLLIRPDGKPSVYIYYTVVKHEVRVCLVEYDAIMTSLCCMFFASYCWTFVVVLSLLLSS